MGLLGTLLIDSAVAPMGPGLRPKKSSDVLSNLPLVDECCDAIRPLERKRNRRRPFSRTKYGPDVQEVYVPCPSVTFKARAAGSKHGKHVGGQYLDGKMPDNNGREASMQSFRDFIYLIPNIRSSSMTPTAGKSTGPHKRFSGKNR